MRRVWFSGGQSNGTGWGTSALVGEYIIGQSILPDVYTGVTSQIKVYNSSSNTFNNLQPIGIAGVGGYNQQGSTYNNCCMEHSFYHRLKEQFPDDTFYNIKYSYGGQSISQLQTQTQSTFTSGINKLTAEGEPFVVEGLLWYQGESDQDNTTEVNDYPTQLTNLINHCVSLSSSDLKVFIVRPVYRPGFKPSQDDWNYMIYDYVRNDSGVTADNKVLFTADDLDVPSLEPLQLVHVAGNGFFLLGTRFFNTYMNMITPNHSKSIGGKIIKVGGDYKTIKTEPFTDETYPSQKTGQGLYTPSIDPPWPV